MLSFDEIKNISFSKGVYGYSVPQVDEVMNDLIRMCETFRNENKKLYMKIVDLENQVEYYNKNNNYIKEALVSAEKIKKSAKQEALEVAQGIVKNAKIKCDEIKNNTVLEVEQSKTLIKQMKKQAEDELKSLKEDYVKLYSDVVNFRTEILSVYREHISTLSKLPGEEDFDRLKSELDNDYNKNDIKYSSIFDNSAEKLESLDDNINANKDINSDTICDEKLYDEKVKPDIRNKRIPFASVKREYTENEGIFQPSQAIDTKLE